MELPARPHLHQNRYGVEESKAEEEKSRKKGIAYQQSGGLRTITYLSTLPETNLKASDADKVPPRSKIQQIWGYRVGSEVSVSDLTLPSVQGAHPLAERLLGGNC